MYRSYCVLCKSSLEVKSLGFLLSTILFLMIPLDNNAQTAAASNSGPVCQGAQLNLFETGGDAVAWLWSTNGSATFSNNTLQNPVVSGAVNGEIFTVVITDISGHSASASTTVTVNPLPAPITGNTFVCLDQNTKLENITSDGTWSSGSPEIATVQSVSGQVRGVSTGTATIFYTLSTGCYRSIDMSVNPTPAAPVLGTVQHPSVGNPTGSAELTGLPQGGWILNPGAIAGTGASYTVSGLTPGSYEFTVTNGCGNVSAATLVTINEIPMVEIKVPLPSGWSWFSVNAMHKDMSPGNILSTCTTSEDYIKDQTGFSAFYPGFGWHGSLNNLNPATFYKTRLMNSCEAAFTGEPIDPALYPINLVAGWNWLGYLPYEQMPLTEALSSMSFSNLDYIKNHNASATYYEGTGWFGTLEYMTPAEGYMIKLARPGTLIYPAKSTGKGEFRSVLSNQSLFDPSAFEFNGSITTSVVLEEYRTVSEKDILYALVDGQIRGLSSPVWFEPAGEWLFTMMIHSNVSQGEVVEFRFRDGENNKYYKCRETVIFRNDMIVADAFKSFRININSSSEEIREFENELQGLHIYPNPSAGKLNIKYSINEPGRVKLSVLKSSGQLIGMLIDQELPAGDYSIFWESPEVSSGIYLIRLETGLRQKTHKVIFIK